jgi:galactonate dehydratase
MIQLESETGVAIATGERLLSRSEYRELLEGGGCSIIQPDLTHAAGITDGPTHRCHGRYLYYIPVAPTILPVRLKRSPRFILQPLFRTF